jgi:hypothetical protein
MQPFTSRVLETQNMAIAISFSRFTDTARMLKTGYS